MARITLTGAEFETLRDSHDDVRAHYGGRGMYGETCLGYVGSEPHLFIFDLAKLLVERESGKPDGVAYSDPTADEIRDEMERLGLGSTDSMGLSTIYYFRSIEVEPGVCDEDDVFQPASEDEE